MRLHAFVVSCRAIVVMAAVCFAVIRVEAAQERPPLVSDDKDHAVVFELGAAGDWSRAEGWHPGGTFAFEITPIEHWLELEIGVTAIAAGGAVEMPVDVLFKKPWRFSSRFEFMIGAGPELVHASGPDGGTFWGGEAVLDFMFWPTKNVGWYLEPGYEITFRDGARQHGFGLAAGLLVGR
ncbi:MAG TPA: hypothetical protein VGJ29_04370 [Vicinamibacterales bacterium]|jgi:hypothetical protein